MLVSFTLSLDDHLAWYDYSMGHILKPGRRSFPLMGPWLSARRRKRFAQGLLAPGNHAALGERTIELLPAAVREFSSASEGIVATTNLPNTGALDQFNALQTAVPFPLPADFVEFCHTWGMVFFPLRSDLQFLPFETMEMYVRRSKLQLPFGVLRFCSIETDNCFALRTQDRGKTWNIVYVDGTDRDEEVMAKETVHGHSFLEWLYDLHRRDASPVLPDLPGAFIVTYDRLPNEEARARFGPEAFELPAISG